MIFGWYPVFVFAPDSFFSAQHKPAQVWAHHPDHNAIPPPSGWHIPFNSPPDPRATFTPLRETAALGLSDLSKFQITFVMFFSRSAEFDEFFLGVHICSKCFIWFTHSACFHLLVCIPTKSWFASQLVRFYRSPPTS